MNKEAQIEEYIASQPEPKRSDMKALHELIAQESPGCRLWFLDGRNDEGRIVSNPNIGYGSYTITYAGGSTRDFYCIGLSSNTSGISVYVMGLADKTFLATTFGGAIGKASVSGYCIKFKSMKDIDVDVLLAAVRHGFEVHAEMAKPAGR